jgi:hypothetical protein
MRRCVVIFRNRKDRQVEILGNTAISNSVSSLFALGSKIFEIFYFWNVTLKCTGCKYMRLNLVSHIASYVLVISRFVNYS